MRATRWSLVVLACAWVGIGIAELGASGFAAVYAIVDKVVLEPNNEAPQRIQVWGIFSLAEGRDGLRYSAPQRGFMYFSLPGAEAVQWRAGGNKPSTPIALAEWADLKRIAGTGAAVAFGEGGHWIGRLRKPTDKGENPETYPIYNGITMLSSMDQVVPIVIARLREAAKVR